MLTHVNDDQMRPHDTRNAVDDSRQLLHGDNIRFGGYALNEPEYDVFLYTAVIPGPTKPRVHSAPPPPKVAHTQTRRAPAGTFGHLQTPIGTHGPCRPRMWETHREADTVGIGLPDHRYGPPTFIFGACIQPTNNPRQYALTRNDKHITVRVARPNSRRTTTGAPLRAVSYTPSPSPPDS